MKGQGYQIKDLPKDPKSLMESLINDPEAMEGSPELSIAHRMTVEEYERLTTYSEKFFQWLDITFEVEAKYAYLLLNIFLLEKVFFIETNFVFLSKQTDNLYFFSFYLNSFLLKKEFANG